jgi:hypothetical protein
MKQLHPTKLWAVEAEQKVIKGKLLILEKI